MRYPLSLLQHPPALLEIWRAHRADTFARERERNPNRLQQYTEEALQKLLRHAYETVPFYRELWNRYGLAPANLTRLDDFSRLPLVSKSDLLAHPQVHRMSTIPAPAWPVWSSGKEMWVMLLNTRMRVLKLVRVYSGTLNSASIRIGEIFKEPIRENAAHIILAHNHPSGDPNPSPEDVRVTQQVNQAGKLLDIELIDHIIIGSQSTNDPLPRNTSLKLRGLGFDTP